VVAWDCENVLGRPRVAVGQSPTLQVAGRAWVAGRACIGRGTRLIGVPRGTLGLRRLVVAGIARMF
jgi:hypothetical protein